MAAIIAFLRTPVRKSRHAEPETRAHVMMHWAYLTVPGLIIGNVGLALLVVFL